MQLFFRIKKVGSFKILFFHFPLFALRSQQKFHVRCLICPVAVWIVVKLAQDLGTLKKESCDSQECQSLRN